MEKLIELIIALIIGLFVGVAAAVIIDLVVEYLDLNKVKELLFEQKKRNPKIEKAVKAQIMTASKNAVDLGLFDNSNNKIGEVKVTVKRNVADDVKVGTVISI